MIEKTLKVASWNVRGMGNPYRGRVVRKWINKFHKNLDILCLQELKGKKEKLDFQLKSLFPQVATQVDYIEEGKTGATVIVLSSLKVLVRGARGDGTFAWCTVETKVGNVSVGSIYASNEREKRIALWDWLHNFLQDGNCVLAGD